MNTKNGGPIFPVEKLTAGMLDRLIPLNAAAVRDLKAAYSSLGTFRDRGELEGRNPLVSDVTEAA